MPNLPRLTPEHIEALETYRDIYDGFKEGDRAGEFTLADEKQLERIYNEWRGTNEKVASCDECIELAFSRLMEEVDKMKTVC